MTVQELKNELKEIIKANYDKDFSIVFTLTCDSLDRISFSVGCFDNLHKMFFHTSAVSFEECKTKLTQYFELQNVVEQQKLEPQPEIEI